MESPFRKYEKQYIINELSQYALPIFIAYMILLISYAILKMLNIQIMVYSLIILICCAFIMFIIYFHLYHHE